MPPFTVARRWNYLEVCEAAQAQGEPGVTDLMTALRRVVAGDLEEWTGEYTCHSPGQRRWFRVRIRQFRIHNTPHALIAHENITSEKQQELRMREAMEEAERANLAKSEFLATMSHELRTPLSGILGTTELLLHTELSGQQREFLEASRSSGEQLARLINDVLDLSKIESGKLELVESECNLHDLVKDLSCSMMPLVEKKRLALEIDLAPELNQPILCDADRLRQILMNLVGNAIKFTLEGRIQIAVQVLWRKNRTVQLRFSVRDSGIGIPEERRHRLFKAFSQADSSASRQFGGTGLGLSICRRLVGLMGGEIGLESQVGIGSVFWFTIPVQVVGGFSNVHAIASPGVKLAIEPSAPVHAGTGRRPRILVAEDNEINQLYMKELLRLLGYDCDIAANGEAALTAFLENRYDAILMDCQMPEMNGFEAATEIRRREASDPARGHIPIIALTANAMQGDRERCLEAGMDEYLSKPVKNDRLRQLLREQIQLEEAEPSADIRSLPLARS
jgi:signal transduction histidine kinase/ActR/RegA family two-component response regulator